MSDNTNHKKPPFAFALHLGEGHATVGRPELVALAQIKDFGRLARLGHFDAVQLPPRPRRVRQRPRRMKVRAASPHLEAEQIVNKGLVRPPVVQRRGKVHIAVQDGEQRAAEAGKPQSLPLATTNKARPTAQVPYLPDGDMSVKRVALVFFRVLRSLSSRREATSSEARPGGQRMI